MKALLLKAPHKVEMVEVETPRPGPSEVLVRVSRAALCGSELLAWHGRHFARIPPVITGHEMSGVVTELGPLVTGLAVGTRVAVMPQKGCQVCGWCISGQTNLCERRVMLGFQAWSGAFAEYVVAPAALLYPVSNALTDEQASLVEPLAVGVHAVRRLGVKSGESLLVLGSGAIGLSVVLAAREAGATTIIASDLYDFNLKLALKLGATHTHKATEEPVKDVISELTNGVGVDHAVLAAEASGLVEQAIRSVRRQGHLAVLASYDEAVPVPLQLLKSRETILMGSVTYTAEDFLRAQQLAEAHPNAVNAMITHVMPLAEAGKAFEMMEHRTEDVVRIVFAV